MPSFMPKNKSSWESGRPTNRRNTADGSGTASSSANSHSPPSMNPSIRSFTSRAMSGSSTFIWRGAKIGSRSRR